VVAVAATLGLASGATAEAATLYIADDDYGPARAGAVFRVPPGGGPELFVVGGFENPEGILASGHFLFVADRAIESGADGRVLRVDLRSGAVRALVSGLADPRGLAMRGGRLYVSDRCRRSLLAVDPATGAARTVARRRLLTRPLGIARHPSGEIYVADYDSASIVAVSPSGMQRLVARGGRLDTPMGVAILGRRVFVIDSNGEDEGELLELGRGGQRLVATIESPEGIAVTGSRLVVADDRPSPFARVISLDPDTGASAEVAVDPRLSDPEGLALGPAPAVPLAEPVPPSGVPPAPTYPPHCGPLR
jgi:DNA-binding beta-propeller fold protein YncE